MEWTLPTGINNFLTILAECSTIVIQNLWVGQGFPPHFDTLLLTWASKRAFAPPKIGSRQMTLFRRRSVADCCKINNDLNSIYCRFSNIKSRRNQNSAEETRVFTFSDKIVFRKIISNVFVSTLYSVERPRIGPQQNALNFCYFCLKQWYTTLSLLPSALRIFLWITAASEFQMLFFALRLFCFHTLSLPCFHTSVWPSCLSSKYPHTVGQWFLTGGTRTPWGYEALKQGVRSTKFFLGYTL